MSHRDNRFSMTPMPHDPAVLGQQGRIGVPVCRQCKFGKRDPKPPVSFGSSPTYVSQPFSVPFGDG